MSDAVLWLAVVGAGGLGGAARLLVDQLVTRALGGATWQAVLLANVSGSFGAGLVVAALDGRAQTVALTGFLGGYTTFSSWIFELDGELRARHAAILAANLLLGLALGLGAAQLGNAIA